MNAVGTRSRRGFLGVGCALAAGLAVPGCAAGTPPRRVRFATGPPEGLWHTFGVALAAQCRERDVAALDVRYSPGPRENVESLRRGTTDLTLNSADVAADTPARGARTILALARVYDDYLQVVVRADSPVRGLADLRGRTVWFTTGNVPALPSPTRLLDAAGMRPGRDLTSCTVPIGTAFDELATGALDALFFSGGLPTPGVARASRRTPLRLLDLADVLPAVQLRYPVYGAATVPGGMYRGAAVPVTTLTVPNYLLVTDRFPDDTAQGVLRAMFEGKRELVAALPSAQSITEDAAVDTTPVPLHPGAVAYYRSVRP